VGEEGSRIITAQAEGSLRQIVSSEGEEIGVSGDLAGREGGTRQFDHRADAVFDGYALLTHHLPGDFIDKCHLMA
jgi:hypothetical protein